MGRLSPFSSHEAGGLCADHYHVGKIMPECQHNLETCPWTSRFAGIRYETELHLLAARLSLYIGSVSNLSASLSSAVFLHLQLFIGAVGSSGEMMVSGETTVIVKPRNDDREYKRLLLSNGLQVLLVSDPDTDKVSSSNLISPFFIIVFFHLLKEQSRGFCWF